MYYSHLLIFVISILCLPFTSYAAVILQYHHVDDQTPAITSITPAQFAKHLTFIQQQTSLQVVPLSTLLKAIKEGDTQHRSMIALTFDDGYYNVFTQARPLLNKFEFPYTIFINPRMVADQSRQFMNWQQLQQLVAEGAEIGNHTGEHHYLVRDFAHLPLEKQLDIITKDLLDSETMIEQRLGQSFRWLAYPYGEFSTDLQERLRQQKFLGFGQHSGAVGPLSDLTRIPRFPASGQYANLETLKDKLYSLPFPILKLEQADPILIQNPPALVIQLEVNDFKLEQITCYVMNQGAVKPILLANNQLEIQAKYSLPHERSRYNCTAPSLEQPNRFYWFSQPWLNLTF